MGDEFGTDVGFLRRVFLFERSGVFSKGPADLTLLFFRQECARTRSPEELFESIQDVLLEFYALEIPDGVPVFKLPGERD